MSFELTVYILLCADGSYYTGSTKKPVEERVWEHNNLQGDSYCARRRPVELIYFEVHSRLTDGHARERQIKGWSRAKKEKLIAGDVAALPALSRRGYLRDSV